MSDEKRRKRARTAAAVGDPSELDKLARDEARREGRPAPVRLRVETHQRLADLAAARKLEPPEILDDAINAGISVMRRNWDGMAIGWTLDLLDDLFRRALAELELSREEACVIMDVMNGTMLDHASGEFIALEVSDGIRLNGLDRKWKLPRKRASALVERLRRASPLHAAALILAARAFWREPERDTDEQLRELGLVRG